MSDLWDTFVSTGKVSDYLAYCKEGEEASHGIQYKSDWNGTFSDSSWGVRQENNDINQRTGQDNSFC